MISKLCGAYHIIRNRDSDMNSFTFHCIDPNQLYDEDYEITVELKDGVVTCSSTLTKESVTFKNRSKEEILKSDLTYLLLVTCSSTLTKESVTFKNRSKEEILKSDLTYEKFLFDINTPEGRILMYTQYGLYELDEDLERVVMIILDAVIIDLLLGREIKYFTTNRIRIEPGVMHVNGKTYDLPTTDSCGVGEFDIRALIP